jgi:diketogulonate reductase-like aldo/keto reductase
MNTPYVDLLLNHWPTSPASPTIDPLCDPEKKATYDAKGCRLSTWRAYVEIWKSGKSLSIGVANYNQTHLEEIISAGMPLPSVNQIPFHLYNAASQLELLAFCKAHNIVVLSYSPLGIPDWHSMPASLPASTPLRDPVLLSITAAHAPATAAQVTLAWLWSLGVPSNPRSMNATHMADNLAAIGSVTLTQAEIAALSSRPLDSCDIDPSFYECVPVAGFAQPPKPTFRA